MTKKHTRKGGSNRSRYSIGASGPVYKLSSFEATRLVMPHYNGFACGHGPHGDVKYNRAREDRRWRNVISQINE